MTSPQKPPIDITLEESSSGTWKTPEAPKLSFKPWQRLWLITGIIYLLMLAGSYHLLMPNQESIEYQMVLSVTEEVKRYDGMAFAGEAPRKIFEHAQSVGYATWIAQVRSKYRIESEGNIGFDKIEKRYREAISDLPVKRIIGILICVAAWLIPMSGLYAIGSVVDWIKRGTRIIQTGRF
jgi:uncharacterized membrane protein